MASIRKRKNVWQARVKQRGYPEQSKSFKSKSAAEAWARMIESEMDRGIFINRTELEKTTLGELLIRYLNEITPSKKGAAVEKYRINAWLKTDLAKRYLSTLKATDFAVWRDNRIKSGAAANTIRLELAVVSNLFNVAKSEWGFESITNLTEHIRTPKLPPGRSRRVSDLEIELIIKHTNSVSLPSIIKIAIESGMRRGEIVALEWKHIDLNNRTALLPDTKNGEARLIPLSTSCRDTIKSLPRNINGRLFNMTPHAISYAFIRACRRAGLTDLHFHSLRHERITRLFEQGFNVMEVAAISGHRSLQMVHHYTHLRAEDLAKKLG